MDAQIINDRFPHYVTITRLDVDTSVNPPTSTNRIILEGKCRNFPPRRGGSSTTHGVFVSDYMISMPQNYTLIKTGDLVLVTTPEGQRVNGVVVNSYNGNLGCQIWHNEVRN